MKSHKGGNPFSLFSFQDIITGLCGIIIFFVLIMLVDLVMQRDASSARACPEEDDITEIEDNCEKLAEEVRSLKARLGKLREQTKRIILAVNEKPSPEEEARLIDELSEKEKEAAALQTQVADLRKKLKQAEEASAEVAGKVKEMEKARQVLEAKLKDLSEKKSIALIPERGESKVPVFLVCGRGGVEIIKQRGSGEYRKWYSFGEMKNGIGGELSDLDKSVYTVILLIRPSGAARMDELKQIVINRGFSYGRDPLEEDVDVTVGRAGDD